MFLRALISVCLCVGWVADNAAAQSTSNQACQLVDRALAREAMRQGVAIEVRCGRSGAAERLGGPAGSPTADVFLVGALPELRSGSASALVRQTAAGEQVTRLHSLPLQLTIRSEVWRLVRSVPGGALIEAGDVERTVAEWPIGTLPLVASGHFEPSRAKRALRAGELLTVSALAEAHAVVRGDLLTVQVREGGLSVEIAARVVASARPGERVRAQVEGRPVVLEGMLASNRTLVLESR